ncbi:MAG: type II toxin-antitoxin system PemK/MazF family toxin [Bacteroidales bacterium]|nr:type II toxin-antitoxin system PemK/MazF family toxin [Bacteroidales bacterium]
MKQRDICLADLNPVQGSEQSGIRPVVVISGNAMNDNLNICIVCPLSSHIKNYAGCIVLKKDDLNQLDHDSEVTTFQVRTISKSRLVKKIGVVTESQLQQILQGLVEVLTY